MPNQVQGKTVIFVDAPNLLGAKEDAGQKELDDGKLLEAIIGDNKDVQIFYYLSSRESSDNKKNSVEYFIGYPDFVLTELQWKLIVESRISINIFPAIKMTVDSRIIEDIFELLFLRRDKKYSFAEIIVISGDRAYAKALKRAKEEGIKVKIITSKNTGSRKLINVADEVAFLEDFIQQHPQLGQSKSI